MKRITVFIVMLIMMTIVFYGCDGDKVIEELQTGKYELKEREEPAFVVLKGEHEFIFVFNRISSYLNRGSYEVKGGKLTLMTYDGEYTYTFRLKKDSLIYLAEESSEIHVSENIQDGAVFVLTPES